MSTFTSDTSPRLLFNNVGWALRTIWATNARLVVGLSSFILIRGLLPAGLALFARGVVNALVALIGSDSADVSSVVPWLVLGFGLTLFEALSPIGHKYGIQRLRDDVNLKVTADILEHAATLDLAFFEDPRSQRVLERAQQNTADRFARFVQEITSTATGVLQILSLASVLAYIEPLVLVVLGPLGLPFLWHQWRLARKLHGTEYNRAPKRRWSRYFVTQLTSHTSIPEVKLFDLAPHFIDRFRTLMTEFRNQDTRLYRRGALGGIVFSIIATLAFYVLFFRVVIHAMNTVLTVGDVAVFGVASSRLRAILVRTITSLSSALEQMLYINNLREFLETKPQLLTTSFEQREPVASPEEGSLTFEAVTFVYPGAEKPTLRNLDFHIEPGEIVGLVGENGAGKTTLAKLICRLYDATEGRVLIDGEDIRAYTLEDLQGCITSVLQNFGRYEATAAENIAYGNWRQLLHDREQVRRIAQMTEADELIQSMSEQYDTMLGRVFGSCDLSGGQWQKLATARAFARHACILILDEPTAFLDARAEYALFQQFRELAKGRTTLLISHRFSTLQMADRILVLDEGVLIENGTHADLVSQGGRYSELYALHRRQIEPV